MAEKKVIEIEIQDNTKSLKAQYREAVQEVQKLVQAYGETSQEAAQAAKRAAELKEQIEDTNDAIAAFKGEGVFNATGKAISSVASGFSAVEGAMGLVGVESEKLQETMLRVQSAMALAQGLEGLEDAGRAFGTLKTVAVNAFNGMSTASKAFLVTGIGLLLAGLGAMIAYWDDISQAIGITNKEQEKYAQKQKAIAENTKKQAEFVGKESAEFGVLIARLKATNEGSKERDALIKSINKEYGTTLKNIKDERDFQEQLNVELATYLEYQRAKYALQKNEEFIERNLATQDRLLRERKKTLDELAILEGEGGKGSEDWNNLLRNLSNINIELEDAKERFINYGSATQRIEGNINKLTNGGKKYVENLKETNKEIQDRIKDELEQIKENNKLALAENQARLRTEQEQEEFAVNEKYSAQIKLAKKHGKDTTQLEIAQANEINEIRLKYQQEQYAKAEELRQKEQAAIKEANRLKVEAENEYLNQIEALQEANFQATLTENEREIQAVKDKYFALEEAAKGNAEQEKIIAEAKAKELEAIDKKSKDKQIEAENELRQKRLQLAGQAFTAIGDIIGSLTAKNDKDARKQFKIQKAFNLAAAVTNTAMAVTGALTAGGNPIKLATGQQIAEAAIVGTMGLANVVKISQTQFGNGSGASGGGGGPSMSSGGGGIVAPNLNVVGDTGINQLAQLGQTPIKAYVVSNDITTAQMFDMKVQQTASL